MMYRVAKIRLWNHDCNTVSQEKCKNKIDSIVIVKGCKIENSCVDVTTLFLAAKKVGQWLTKRRRHASCILRHSGGNQD